MTILVTGAGGFLGGYLCKKLQADGHCIIAHHLADGDLTLPATLACYDKVDYVYHLAARTFVPDSWNETYNYFQTNVMSTANILEFCRRQRCGVALMSTYVYGEPQYLPVDENHPVSAITPYHQSKLMCESLGAFYWEKFDLPITVFRPFNIYGKGQSDAFLLPTIVKQLLDPDCKEIVVMDLSPRRDYVYVDDVVEILSRAVHPHKAGFRVFNVGSGQSVSVEDAILAAMVATGTQKPYRSKQQVRQGEVSDCVADMRRVRAELGEVTLRSISRGLKDWLAV